MKNLDLASMNVREMNTLEMKETDGGIFVLLVVAAAALLIGSSCINEITIPPPEIKPQEPKPPSDIIKPLEG